jgi:transcriptional regulator with XRE-family HTH domain
MRHWRTDHLSYSQETLARRANKTPTALSTGTRISPSTIAMIESGRRQPSRLVADILAEAMGIPVGAFAFVADTDLDADEVA